MRAATSAAGSSSAQRFCSNGFLAQPSQRRAHRQGSPEAPCRAIARLSGVAVAAALTLGAGTGASGAGGYTFTFTKIADTNTPIPGGTGTFEGFSATAISDDTVVFSGYGQRREDGRLTGGVYSRH